MLRIFFSVLSFIFATQSFAVELKPNPIWPTPNSNPLDPHEEFQAKAIDYLSPIQLGHGEHTQSRDEYFDVVQNNSVRALYFSRFQTYIQYGVYEQQGKCFVLSAHHVWSNSRLIKAQDVAEPNFPNSLRFPPAELTSSNWEFIGPIPKLPNPIPLPGNCSSQKSNIDKIFEDLKIGFKDALDKNFEQIYQRYLSKFQSGSTNKNTSINSFDRKLNINFERNY